MRKQLVKESIENRREMFSLHESGKTYAEIAEIFGLSVGYVGALVRGEKRKNKQANWRDDPFLDLSVRSSNCILSLNIKSVEELRCFLESGKRIPNIGKKGLEEICRVYEISLPTSTKQAKPNKSLENAIELLKKHGYKISK